MVKVIGHDQFIVCKLDFSFKYARNLVEVSCVKLEPICTAILPLIRWVFLQYPSKAS